jgi:signal recognition particle subunit SRP54
MGGFMSLMKMIPGMGGALPDNLSVDDGEFNRIEGIINSMTKRERQNPEILGVSRRQRIAKGSGVSLTDVNQLIKQFMQMRQMMSRLGRGGGMGAAMGELMAGGGSSAGGAYGMGRHGSATKAAKKPRKKREKPKNKKKRR